VHVQWRQRKRARHLQYKRNDSVVRVCVKGCERLVVQWCQYKRARHLQNKRNGGMVCGCVEGRANTRVRVDEG
jgi:hypothetical protein